MNSPIGRKPLFKLLPRFCAMMRTGNFTVTPVENAASGWMMPVSGHPMNTEGEGKSQVISFETNVDDEVIVNTEHPLRFETEAGTSGLKPYVLVRRVEALVSRALFYDLVAKGTVEGEWFVWSSGEFFPMQRADEI
jgi:hypothetical protein